MSEKEENEKLTPTRPSVKVSLPIELYHKWLNDKGTAGSSGKQAVEHSAVVKAKPEKGTAGSSGKQAVEHSAVVKAKPETDDKETEKKVNTPSINIKMSPTKPTPKLQGIPKVSFQTPHAGNPQGHGFIKYEHQYLGPSQVHRFNRYYRWLNKPEAAGSIRKQSLEHNAVVQANPENDKKKDIQGTTPSANIKTAPTKPTPEFLGIPKGSFQTPQAGNSHGHWSINNQHPYLCPSRPHRFYR